MPPDDLRTTWDSSVPNTVWNTRRPVPTLSFHTLRICTVDLMERSSRTGKGLTRSDIIRFGLFCFGDQLTFSFDIFKPEIQHIYFNVLPTCTFSKSGIVRRDQLINATKISFSPIKSFRRLATVLHRLYNTMIWKLFQRYAQQCIHRKKGAMYTAAVFQFQ